MQMQCKRRAIGVINQYPITNKEETNASSKKARARRATPSWPVEDDIDEETRKAYLELRRAKHAGTFTAKGYDLMKENAASDGVGMKAAIEKCIERGWGGYYPDANT